MFDEQENKNLENLNNWKKEAWNETRYDKEVYINRYENFLCMKDESMEMLKERFWELIIKLDKHKVWYSTDDKKLKFVEALPLEWNKFVNNELKRDSRLSRIDLRSLLNTVTNHQFHENADKRKLLDDLKEESGKIDLNIIIEIRKRIDVCLAAKKNMRYDIKRGCYIDKDSNPLDFVKLFCAGTYEKMIEDGSKCEKSEADSMKLLKDVESLTLENNTLKNEKKADDEHIQGLRLNCEKLRFDHSAQMPNQGYKKRNDYHKATQCYDLSVWYENGIRYEREKRYDNRVCYSCGYQGHIAVNCQRWNYETRRCFNCNIRGHIARDCPRRSMGRSRAESQRMAKKPVNVKPKGQKVQEPKVQEQKVQETKVKLSQGQKDRLRKKRKKAREYLERILSSGSPDKSNNSADETIHSTTESSKPNSSDANLRTKKDEKKVGDESDMSKSDKPPSGDESDRSKSDKPHSGNDSGSTKPEEPVVEVKTIKPKAGQAWVDLFK
ncbi:putative transcription factor interactor and regulator CCHC(Zn) family [Helianthus annuus]|nr:putative transcription factor interactor and regulator CCHC(Zn) family [Helianthus annuus]KAJ0535333.1 putative transcription factor interactor and regulator CCHC(Zn) family [Helianthus annuus]KAJ0543192.1 putative transcription factor interactor and regulator CCHC(Zn) family [Helianthus annuus]KAJ0708243.1 putative transcription factor interactor and regulator CCHC(Zn) family [Helianthus annuus]KAJ0712200.1 putative transcription factor interactor and regulator CCHC(Zn) family [Helianthus a